MAGGQVGSRASTLRHGEPPLEGDRFPAATPPGSDVVKRHPYLSIKLDRAVRGSGGFGFGEVVDVGESLEVDVLRPKCGVVVAGGGVNQRVGYGELVRCTETGGEHGNLIRHRGDVVLAEEGQDGLSRIFSRDPLRVSSYFIQ
jgi:hypothetical protein